MKRFYIGLGFILCIEICNAQQEKAEIDFKGVKYANNGAGGFPFHALSLELTRKNFVIPAMVVLDEKLEILDVVNFYQTPEWANKIAHYFGSDDYKTMKWEDFLKKPTQTSGK